MAVRGIKGWKYKLGDWGLHMHTAINKIDN